GTGEVLVNSGGGVIFDRTDTHTVSNRIVGAGGIGSFNTGTTILTADNTFSGGMSVVAGTVQIGAGGTTGSIGAGTVTTSLMASTGTLAFNRSDQVTFGNFITGNGNLRQ